MSASDCKPQVPPRNPPGARRHPALAIRRDLGGAVPHPGLRLRQLRAGRAPASRARSRATSIRASPIRPSTMFEAAHGRVRRRRSRARDRDRHGRGHARADGPGQGRRPRRRGEGAVRLLPLRGRGLPAALRRRPRRWSTAPISTQWRAAVRPNTKTFFLETPTNPTLEVIDIAEVAKIAHAAGATLVVDNVFSTPLWQSPLELGADCVVYSATKHIDGQGRCLGGVDPRLGEVHHGQHPQPASGRPARRCRRSMPGCCSRDWRRWRCACARQTDTAATVADRAGQASEGLAADLSRPAGPSAGRDRRRSRCAAARRWWRSRSRAARRARSAFQDALKLVRISNNLGDAKSLITHPATTTHQRLKPAAARRARHQRRHGAAVVRARASRRSDRGPADGAESGVSGLAAGRARGGGHRRAASRPRGSRSASSLATQP